MMFVCLHCLAFASCNIPLLPPEFYFIPPKSTWRKCTHSPPHELYNFFACISTLENCRCNSR